MSVDATPATADMQRWFFRRQHTRAPELFCFPHAGGSAHAFLPWVEAGRQLGLEVSPVQLPGRANRMSEAVVRSIPDLARRVARAIASSVRGPFGLLGHSYGSLLAFEVAHLLVDSCVRPEVLFVAASRSPTDAPATRLHEADDARLLSVLDDLGGVPEAVLRHRELMDLLLPVVRGDLEAYETYVPPPRPRLTVPLVAISADADRATPPDVVARWSTVATDFVHLRFEGGHFFLHDPRILDAVRERLVAPCSKV